MFLPKGVACTMLSAYNEKNELDYEAVSAMLEWYLRRDVKIIFGMCHSTELHLLSMKERMDLVSFVRKTLDVLEKKNNKKIPLVAAGTFGNTQIEMRREIQEIYSAGADAVVLITNRLDPEMKGGSTLVANAEALLSILPDSIPLGLYECPEPYKRVLTTEEFRWAAKSGRFYFIKDTCCNPDLIKERLEVSEGTPLQLFNANAQTLLYSLRLGAAGYSSTMANVHPQLYAWMCKYFEQYPETAERLQRILTFTALAEVLQYPLTAKYVMRCEGVPVLLNSRLPGMNVFDHYNQHIMDDMIALTKEAESSLPDMDNLIKEIS